MKKYHHLVWRSSNIEHIGRHNVSPDEVEQAVFTPAYRVRKGRGEDIYYAFGQTQGGRYLFIVLRDLRGGVGEVVTARNMSYKEKTWYQR